MSLRLEMLQVARLAPTLLGEEATERVHHYVLSQEAAGGGFCDRDGTADLYYTSFAIDVLTALQTPLPDKLSAYLSSVDLASLDFVHLCCLARSKSALSDAPPREAIDAVLAHIESYRTPDGGYNQATQSPTGSAYACLLAYGAYADHSHLPPDSAGITRCMSSLVDPSSGAYVNDRDFPVGNAPATAAAITLARSLRFPIAEGAADFLLRCFHAESGGFLPFPGAPLPDLLSTAVVLHALDGLQIPFADKKDAALDFIDTLWTADGGFHGSWEDHTLDIEYTYYGLLALGHLSL